MPRRRSTFSPFAGRSRRTIVAILVTFALCWGLSVVLSITATRGSQHRAAVVEVAARQRTLAESYVNEILLVRAGEPADPAATATVLVRSADALLNGGTAPEVKGDDDATALPAASGTVIRRQLMQEKRLAVDLTAAGSALLAHTSPAAVPITANEHINVTDPVERVRILAGLTSNVSLNAARTIATTDDADISNLIITQSLLGIGGLSTSLLLALGLIAATRRQTAHFRSLVDSSTDLVLVFGADGCRYASQSVTRMLGHPDTALLGAGFAAVVHADDRELVQTAASRAEPREIVFGIQNHLGEWRQLEAHLTDLRSDRHIRGVVLNARDVSERVRLEEQLVRQAYHDDLTQLANRVLFRDRPITPWPGRNAPPLRWRCCSSTWTGSSRSTTVWATTPATSFCVRWPSASPRRPDRATRSPASAATSSACWWRMPTQPTPRRSPTGCCRACPSR